MNIDDVIMKVNGWVQLILGTALLTLFTVAGMHKALEDQGVEANPVFGLVISHWQMALLGTCAAWLWFMGGAYWLRSHDEHVKTNARLMCRRINSMLKKQRAGSPPVGPGATPGLGPQAGK